jgi:hypothetical protein
MCSVFAWVNKSRKKEEAKKLAEKQVCKQGFCFAHPGVVM